MDLNATHLTLAKDVCAQVGAHPQAPAPHEKLGLSRSARSTQPLQGLRVNPTAGTCGWYIWAGELSAAEDFFEPVHVSHLETVCPLSVGFLSLPPGWRFLTDGDYVDVWFDPDPRF